MLPQAEVLQDWLGLSDSHWRCQPKPSWLQGPFHKLCLPQLPANFSHASTAAQLQQLIALCVVPVLPAKHQIKGIEDLMRLPSPATTGRQPRLPLVKVPQQSCLVPSKLQVRRQEGLANEGNGNWRLTLQRSGRSCTAKGSEIGCPHLPCAAWRPRRPRADGYAPVWQPLMHPPKHMSWQPTSVRSLYFWNKHTPLHIPRVAQNVQARAMRASCCKYKCMVHGAV